MTDTTTIADDALRGLVTALATHDPEQVLAVFTEDGAVYGSDDGEEASGTDMRTFFSVICSRTETISWTWQVQTAGRDGDVVWFVAPGVFFATAPDGRKVRGADPYRLSGVLRRTEGRWLFALFNGSEPNVLA